ncbi:MAG: hypothetical protein V3T70_06690, partial [Phycisphaerae bacterium]
RYRSEDREDRRRVLTGYSRFHETPPEIVIELTDDGYRTVGAKADAKRADRLDVIAELLPADPPGMRSDEVREAWPDNGVPMPGKRTIQADLKHGESIQRWAVTGAGIKQDPLRFWIRDSIRARTLSIGCANRNQRTGSSNDRACPDGSVR